MIPNKKSFITLFCGCGGFDLGFENQGFRCIGAFDNSAVAVQTHKRNLGAPAYYTADLSVNFSIADIDTPDIVIAGPPCQGFSIAGTRKHDDPRNSLLVSAARIAVKIRPKIVIIENVMGVKAGTHHKFWLKTQRTLKSAGYKVEEILCEAIKSGIPQTRKRMIIFAWRTSFAGTLRLKEVPSGVLASCLKDLDDVPNHEIKLLNPDSDAYLIAQRIRQGQKLSNVRGGPRYVHSWNIPDVFGQVSNDEKVLLETLMRLRRRLRRRKVGDADPVHIKPLKDVFGNRANVILDSLLKKGYIKKIDDCFDLKNTFNGLYWRLDPNEPAPTVDTRFAKPRHFLHPHENRGLTVREAARIQGFPDDFVFEGSIDEQSTLVGNAVPPPMAEIIADAAKTLM